MVLAQKTIQERTAGVQKSRFLVKSLPSVMLNQPVHFTAKVADLLMESVRVGRVSV